MNNLTGFAERRFGGILFKAEMGVFFCGVRSCKIGADCGKEAEAGAGAGAGTGAGAGRDDYTF